MKKFLKSTCIILALSVMMGLFTACPNSIKKDETSDDTKSQTDDREDETTRETETTASVTVSEPDQSDDTDETGPEETSSTDASAAGTTAKPAAKTYGKTTVTVAYKKDYGKNQFGYKAKVRVPKVTIAGVNTKQVNQEILTYCKAKSGKECSCSYSYYIGKNYVSILIKLQEEHDMSPAAYFAVYNISRSSGKKLTKKQMLKILGLSNKKFNSRVKKAITKMFKKSYGYSSKAPSYLKKTYKDAVKAKTIKRAVPYVNSKGKVSYMIKLLPCPGGAGEYDEAGTC